MGSASLRHLALAGSIAATAFGMAIPAQAAPIITAVNQDLTSGDYSFSFMGGTFTFSPGSGFARYIAVKTAGNAAVRTVFGGPSTDFTNRGTVVYDANTLGGFGAVPTATSIPFSNSDNFLGLKVTSGGNDYYGFAYTTNSIFNSYGFETTPNTGITAVTTLTTGVPEPMTWALMVVGFGAVGAVMRRTRRAAVAVSYG